MIFLFPQGTLCLCKRHFATHLRYKPKWMAEFSQRGTGWCPQLFHSHHLQLDGLVSICLSSVRLQCRGRAGRRGDEASQSCPPSSLIKAAWIKSESFGSTWNKEWKRGWTPLLLWCCSENLAGLRINRTEWKGCRNQMLWYFWMHHGSGHSA